MKISEIKEQLESGKTLGDIVKVRQYISFIEKKIIIEKIVDSCLEIKDGILTVDQFNKRLVFDISILSNYADIEFGDEFIQEYDWLCENKIMTFVEDSMNGEERYFISDMVYEVIEDRLRQNNSIEAILARGINNIISKIPDEKTMKKIMADIPKQINKIKPENMEIIKGIIKQ